MQLAQLTDVAAGLVDGIRGLRHVAPMVETINISQAKAHFSDLLARVEAGERIVIARAGHPIAELRPITHARPPRVPGMDRGRVVIHDNFDDPLPDLEEYM
jgi:prevent-host-death family protein